MYGIVHQSGGFITVTSTPGGGTILVVEDSAQLRELFRDVLELHGYRVLDAPNGLAALEVAAGFDGTIDLLLTDVIMPEMNGRELARSLVQRWPGLKTLFLSGYADEAIVRHGLLEPGVFFLQKPFTPEGLARKVRETLEHRL